MKRPTKHVPSTPSAERVQLRRRAEGYLKKQPTGVDRHQAEVDTRRLLLELQVHQVELEMQNLELQEARDRTEVLLEKYTDLYDYAPVGYLSVNEQGEILEVNLSGATLLGVARSRLVNRRLATLVTSASRPDILSFLKNVFAGAGPQVCEAALLKAGGTSCWANFHGTPASAADGSQKWCRVVVSDITTLKREEEAQRRLEVLASVNHELRGEIARRQVVEKSLKESERHHARLLEQSHQMQEELRHLSREVLQVQEDERKRISRELHDVIAQTLTGINIRLATLKKEAGTNPKGFERNLVRTQRLVEKSVNIVHRFARELRPAVLDDLGLIPALHSFLKQFAIQTGLRTHLTVFAGVEHLDQGKRTVLYRVAQEALTNVARHAQATRVDVSVRKFTDGIRLAVKDDGKSFQVKLGISRGKKHLGLLGMRERVEMVGGRFEVKSAPGQGTTVIAEIPPPVGPAKSSQPQVA